jgi:hypothetical protein
MPQFTDFHPDPTLTASADGPGQSGLGRSQSTATWAAKPGVCQVSPFSVIA